MKTTFFNLWKTVFPPSCFWHKYQHFLKYAGFPSIQTVLIMGKYRPSTDLIFVRKRFGIVTVQSQALSINAPAPSIGTGVTW